MIEGGFSLSLYQGLINRGIEAEKQAKGEKIKLTVLHTKRMRFFAFVVVVHAASVLHAQVCAPKWDTAKGLPGMNSTVNTIATYDDGRGEAVYVGGRFTEAGSVSTSKIAKWDGRNWSALGKGIGAIFPTVNTLAVFHAASGDVLIAGGQFDEAGGLSANNVAQWDGFSWSNLGTGTNGSVFATTSYPNPNTLTEDLIVGGLFTTAGGVNVSQIAGWNGLQWYALGDGLNGKVSSLRVYDDGSASGPALYAGGSFNLSGEIAVRNIAKWDGDSWASLGNGVSGQVFAMSVFDDGTGLALFTGGDFTRADGNKIVVNRIAKWDGTNWSALSTGTDSTVRAMTVFDDGTGFGESLYIGGIFTTAGSINANRIAMWDGAFWFSLDGGMGNPVFGLSSAQQISTVGPAVYAGGSFLTVNDQPTNYIARWTGCFDRPGDINGDGFTDLVDYQTLQFCLRGPDIEVSGGCETSDLDLDGDADLFDVNIFQNYFFPPN